MARRMKYPADGSFQKKKYSGSWRFTKSDN